MNPSGSGVHEECGVFGMYNYTGGDVVTDLYYGISSLQHRGQESCGIAVTDTLGPRGRVSCEKDLGLVQEVFQKETLECLHGNLGIGHVRYSTTGATVRENTQPLVLKYYKGSLCLAHNGNLVNAAELRQELEESGALFTTTIDSEVIAYLIARERIVSASAEDAVARACSRIRGAYALVVASPRKLIGVRDPHGLRPLCIGRKENTWIFASESCAITSVGGTFVRDVEPGEIVSVMKDGSLKNIETAEEKLDMIQSWGFRVTEGMDLKNKTILLLDDMYQSGVTMQYVAMRLKEAGAKRVFGMAIVKSLGY